LPADLDAQEPSREQTRRRVERSHGAGVAVFGGLKERSVVTTCPRCGQTSRAGTTVCPVCGTALQPTTGGLGARDAGQPDWLRHLQANQAPGMAEAGAQPPFPPNGFQQPGMSQTFGAPGQGHAFAGANMLSDDALPAWLRGAAAAPQAPAPQPMPAR